MPVRSNDVRSSEPLHRQHVYRRSSTSAAINKSVRDEFRLTRSAEKLLHHTNSSTANPMLDADDASVYLSRGVMGYSWTFEVMELKLKVSKLAERQRISEEKKKAKKKSSSSKNKNSKKGGNGGQNKKNSGSNGGGAASSSSSSSSASSVKSRKGRDQAATPVLRPLPPPPPKDETAEEYMNRRYTEIMALQTNSIHFEHLTKRERARYLEQEKRDLRDEENAFERAYC